MKNRNLQIKRFLKFFGIGIAILVGGIFVAGQIAYQSISEIDSPPGKMYSVNDGQIHMYCTGSQNTGKPTIIIVSGGGTPSIAYFPLQERLSEITRTCSYDSAGIGWSNANDIPYTAKNLSDELHLLLQTAQVDGPIILAGHSIGGIISLIYSAEHEEQVAGIAFIDSSHYNQMDYFGKEFRKATDKQIDEQLENFWLIELGSNLGIFSLMTIFNNSELEDMVQHKKLESFIKWNPPYTTIKSMISNLSLSLEQGKQAHYFREDLPIVSISASDDFFDESAAIGGISPKEYREGFKYLHKDLAGLSSNGRYVEVNGTNHISIVFAEETANYILSIIPEINDRYPIDSKCDWFLVHQLEYQLPEPSKWYLDNFSEEYHTLLISMGDAPWDYEDYQILAFDKYHESLKKKTIPELRNFDWSMLEPGEEYFAEVMAKDPQCHEIVKTNYPGFDAFK